MPDLGQHQETVIEPCAAVLPHLWIGEAVVAVPALEARVAGRFAVAQAAEESLIGALHAQQHILQDLGIDRGIFWKRRFQIGQFGLLLIVGGAFALPALPPGAALFQRAVVEHAAAPQDRFQRLRLCGRWPQFVLIGLADGVGVRFHTMLFCPIGRKAATRGTVVA